MPERWKRSPKPDQAVLALIEELHKAAQKGEVRAVAIVTLNPNLDVETVFAGLTDKVRRRLIASGLTEAFLQVLKEPDSDG